MRKRYNSDTAFLDLLFNVLLGFVVLFIIALLMVNPITKKNDVPFKAEFMILVEWEPGSEADVDVWVKGPSGPTVGFANRETSLLHLDRDDLGSVNDMINMDGEMVVNPVNREIITIRGIEPGDYLVNLHLYSNRGKPVSEPIPVTVTVMDLNPFQEAYIRKLTFTLGKGEVLFLPGFSINSDGKIYRVFNSNQRVVPVRRGGP